MNLLKQSDIGYWVKLLFIFAVIRVATTYYFNVPANFMPIEALAIFATTLVGRNWKAILLPLLAVMLSDSFVNYSLLGKFTPIYSGFYWQYLGYGLLIFFGGLMQNRWSTATVALTSVSGAVLFYLISNFGVWTSGLMYPMTASGLMTAYIMGLPFLKTAILGNLCYAFLVYFMLKPNIQEQHTPTAHFA